MYRVDVRIGNHWVWSGQDTRYYIEAIDIAQRLRQRYGGVQVIQVDYDGNEQVVMAL